MPPSYRFIDYRVRPAKHIERKMLLEAFSRLHPFAPIDQYQYVGFGAIYFADFALFHRSLGIERMVTMERHLPEEDRIRFNAPFECIDVQMGESNDLLPDIDWQFPTIAWLDYDGRLDGSGVQDVATFLRKAKVASVVVITVNAQLDRGENNDEDPVSVIRERVGATFVPPGIQPADLASWGTARTTRRIIANVVAETLNAVNGQRDPQQQLQFEQLFNFEYDDGAKMLTVGGILYDQSTAATLKACEFDKLSFVRSGDDAYRIATPMLTPRELRHLDKQLPCLDWSKLTASGVPAADLEKYARVYRYFPLFAETLL